MGTSLTLVEHRHILPVHTFLSRPPNRGKENQNLNGLPYAELRTLLPTELFLASQPDGPSSVNHFRVVLLGGTKRSN